MLEIVQSVVSVIIKRLENKSKNRMADVPLTEKRLLEILDDILEEKLEKKLEEKLEEKLEKKFKEKLDPIYKELKGLRGFQYYESEAIEYELQEVLETYLIAEYPLMKVERFRIKKLSDPKTQQDITDFDAAFLLQNIKYYPDYSRVKEAGLPTPKTKADYTDTAIFIVAEAKHYIDKDKIKEKLAQFDRIRKIFNLIKHISELPENQRTPKIVGVSSKFINTVNHHKYLANVQQIILFFGAAFWQKNLLKDIKGAVSIYKNLISRFNTAQPEQKLNFYKQICSLENNWYEPGDAPNSSSLSPDAIVKLNTIDGAMNYVNFIEPSGGRYMVVTKKEKVPFGITSIPLQGGKLRKTKKKHVTHTASAHNS
jgi:hypothetical protein